MSEDVATADIESAFTAGVAETENQQAPAKEQRFFSEEEYRQAVSQARAQEKDKLYSEIERLKEQVTTFSQRQAEREAEEERARKEAQDAARRKQEEEMDVRSLLERKEQEFAQQLEAERLEREKAFALLDQERQYQELQQYRQNRMQEESDLIIPELLDLVSGSSQDEIEQSIAEMKERSSRILESAQQAMQATRREMAGARVTAPAAGPMDTNSEQQTFTADQIRTMSFNDYVKNRSRLLGQASGQRSSGLFG